MSIIFHSLPQFKLKEQCTANFLILFCYVNNSAFAKPHLGGLYVPLNQIAWLHFLNCGNNAYGTFIIVV